MSTPILPVPYKLEELVIQTDDNEWYRVVGRGYTMMNGLPGWDAASAWIHGYLEAQSRSERTLQHANQIHALACRTRKRRIKKGEGHPHTILADALNGTIQELETFAASMGLATRIERLHKIRDTLSDLIPD